MGVTSRTLRDWAEAPRNNDGTYDGPVLVEWLVGLRAGGSDHADQRQRLAAAQAEKVETENAIRRGELAVISEVQTGWAEHIAAARAKLLSMPTKLGPQLTNVADPNVIGTRIRVEINAALGELAEWEPPAPPVNSDDGGNSPASDQGMVAAAEPVSKPVGRRKKKAQ